MNVVNRTACYFAVLYCFIILCKSSFCINGCHAKESGHPHPEDSPRTTSMDSRSNTDDVARADRSGQSCAQSLEAVYVAFALVLSREDELQRSRQTEDLQQWRRTVSIRPVPMSRTSNGGPQTKLSMAFNVSNIFHTPLLLW